MQESTHVQHKFEQAVWEVSFVLQKSADDPASGGARQKEYVARIRQALVSFCCVIHPYHISCPIFRETIALNYVASQKNLIAVADEASEKDVILRWKNNPIFEWQSHLESSKWIPAYLASQCKANFAWFVVNVETSAGKGPATRPPGMGKLGVKEEEPIQVDDAVPVKLEDAGPEEKEKKTRTPVKQVMSIKKPLIITSIGAPTPPATPLFNAKLHVRNDPKVNNYPVSSFIAGPFLNHLCLLVSSMSTQTQSSQWV